MFEALFILTTIDTGTRVARFLFQEALGNFYAPFKKTDWMPGTIICSALVVFCWGYFIYTGNISTIWPMFGVANQLLAAIALCIGTSIIIKSGRVRYMGVTLVPMCFMSVITLSAGYLNIRDNFFPMTVTAKAQTIAALTGSSPGSVIFQGYLNCGLTVIMMAGLLVIIVDSLIKWRGFFKVKSEQ